MATTKLGKATRRRTVRRARTWSARSSTATPWGGPPTRLTGTVFDPARAVALYDVYAHIPNGTPAPIPLGNPTCTQCQAPASGSPLLGVLTDPTGKFDLQKGPKNKWGVLSGDNIPMVLQIGKW